MKKDHRKGMLIVLPVPFKIIDNEIYCEIQACTGLENWADNFGSLIVAAPVIPEALLDKHKHLVWRNATTLNQLERFEFVQLPWAYYGNVFFKTRNKIEKELSGLIQKSKYLQFAIGGLVGDWGAIGAIEAIKQKREFCIHIDRVESNVMLANIGNIPSVSRQQMIDYANAIRNYQIDIIKQCKLSLLQGKDCFDVFHQYCDNSFLIYDIHTTEFDHIKEGPLNEKVIQLDNNEPIELVYAGRLEAMKGPLEWVESISLAVAQGINIRARWIGSGSLYDEVLTLIEKKGLSDVISLSAQIADRETLLEQLRKAHILLFTHKTQEAARCLLESLVCGTAIVGYQTNHSLHLVKEGGGLNVADRTPAALAKELVSLVKDTARLKKMILDASVQGKKFNEKKVFTERSDLIKEYLN